MVPAFMQEEMRKKGDGKPVENTPLQKVKVVIFVLRGDFHAKFIIQNIKMFSVWLTHTPLKTSRVTKYFFCYKTSYIGTMGNKTTAKGLPTIPW